MNIHIKLYKSANETYFLLKEVYGNERLSYTRVFDWFKYCQNSQKDNEDDLHSGHHCSSKPDENIKKIGNLIRS